MHFDPFPKTQSYSDIKYKFVITLETSEGEVTFEKETTDYLAFLARIAEAQKAIEFTYEDIRSKLPAVTEF